MQRAVLRAGAGALRDSPVIVRASHLGDEPRRSAPASPPDEASPSGTLREQVDDFRRQTILRALERHDGNWAAAARALGLHRSNLHHLATRLGLR